MAAVRRVSLSSLKARVDVGGVVVEGDRLTVEAPPAGPAPDLMAVLGARVAPPN